MESHSRGEAGKTSVVFSPTDPNAAGTLAKFLKIFDDYGVDLTHIESRSSTRGPGNEKHFESNIIVIHFFILLFLRI